MNIFSKQAFLCLLFPVLLFSLHGCHSKSIQGTKSRTYELRVIPTRSSAKFKFDEATEYARPSALSLPGWKGCDGKKMRGAFSKCTLGKINQYINENLQIPDSAIQSVIEGDAGITFLVDDKGHISNPLVTKDPGGGIASEVERLVMSFPEWESALINGQDAVPAEISMEIRFDIVLR